MMHSFLFYLIGDSIIGDSIIEAVSSRLSYGFMRVDGEFREGRKFARIDCLVQFGDNTVVSGSVSNGKIFFCYNHSVDVCGYWSFHGRYEILGVMFENITDVVWK